MRFGKINSLLVIFLVIAFLITTFLYAGDADRVGTAGGTQLQVPVGGRNFAMVGADIASTASVDAMYWNPAGLGEMSGRAAGLFSTRNIIADINMNYFAAGFNAGKLGYLGLSVKTFDFGDIPVTTTEDMDGTGATYSPTFSTFGLTYARRITDRINFGFSGKVIYESIPRASASAFAIDLGIQYKNLVDIEGLNMGLCLRNIGTDMKYSGSAMVTEAKDAGETFEAFRYRQTSSDQLPSAMEMGLSYVMSLGFGRLTVSSTFQYNNFENDQVKLGVEFGMTNMLYVRGGYALTLTDPDNEELGANVYGMAFGGGIKYPIMGMKAIFSYTYKPVEYFSDVSNTFTLGFEL